MLASQNILNIKNLWKLTFDNGHAPAQPLTFHQKIIQQNGSQTYIIMFQQIVFQQKARGQFFPSD
jgi:hypothetical protein